MSGYFIEEGEYGPRFVLTGNWSDRMLPAFDELGVQELVLNRGKGWCGSELSFVSQFPHLQCLEILAYGLGDSTLKPIHGLHQLKRLTFYSYNNDAIDFGAFPCLEECNIEWSSRRRSLFDCSTLRHLCINRYNGQNLDDFASLTNLKSLMLLTAPVKNIRGISGLSRLQRIRFALLTKLSSLDGIQTLSHLNELWIQTCEKLHTLEPLASLLSLRRLSIENCGGIDTLKHLEKLRQLESLSFIESTNILDGDLSILNRLPSLRSVIFMERKHYSHRREDFPHPGARPIRGKYGILKEVFGGELPKL